MEKVGKQLHSFWIDNYRVSFLLLFLVFIAGIISLLQIPKESSPDIEFGIIAVTTIYSGVNPEDIDSLITEKIENEIDDIDGISKITSTSSVGVSSVVVELENGVSTRDAMTDIKDRVDATILPADAEDPIVRDISTNNEMLFQALLYTKTPTTHFELMQKGRQIQSALEGGTSQISSIDVGGSAGAGEIDQSSSNSSDYDIEVQASKEKLELLGITVPQIASALNAYNKNTPLGNFTIGDLNYDFRFEGELDSISDLENTIISGTGASLVRVKDVAEIRRKYENDSIQSLGFYDMAGYPYISLIVNKDPGASVFSVSKSAKQSLEDYIATTPGFEEYSIVYSQDLSESIMDDYRNLASTAAQTFFLVFLTIFLFIGIRESLIASILLPASFFATFTVLNLLGLSLNFLTNFSLVLTLGIAIDTIIVIIEGASERQKLGYSRHSAPILAIGDLQSPLISGTLTTLVAFLPMMFLPGIIGRFLSYIPITVFTTLSAALILSLTVAGALFFKLAQQKKTYIESPQYESSLSAEETSFLQEERTGKIALTADTKSTREKVLERLSQRYYNILKKFLESRKSRILSIMVPFILLILTFIFLSPRIGFTLFPQSDEGIISMSVEGPNGASEESMEPYLPQIERAIAPHPELKVFYVTLKNNVISIYIELTESGIREKKNQRDVFAVEEDILERLQSLASSGLLVEARTISNGPPQGSPVGIKLHANSSSKINELSQVANDFKLYLQGIQGTKNVTTSSQENPGQFVFRFDNSALSFAGLSPDDILPSLRASLAGIKASSIQSIYEDNEIVVLIQDFESYVSPQDIENIVVPTKIGNVRVGNYASYSFEPGLSSIGRDNTLVTIGVDSDIESGYLPTDIQPELMEFAANYVFPAGISYSGGGENNENAELIQSTLQSFFIAVFLIFTILVFQFNSYSQPLIILYSVVLALLGVNIGLWITGNPYSMTFGIGFIALTGVVVNDAIILVDRINRNIDRMVRNAQGKKLTLSDYEQAILAAGEARLQPIMVTTLTTIFGVLPLALQDAFWAGLGFTMIFGLLAGSSMTLFVIPALYYNIYLRKKMNS